MEDDKNKCTDSTCEEVKKVSEVTIQEKLGMPESAKILIG
jgi:hypothetical protein